MIRLSTQALSQTSTRPARTRTAPDQSGAYHQVAEALAEGRTPPAVRLRTILKYALKLVGLALVGIGTSLPEASAALCCALVAYEALASARCAPAAEGIPLILLIKPVPSPGNCACPLPLCASPASHSKRFENAYQLMFGSSGCLCRLCGRFLGVVGRCTQLLLHHLLIVEVCVAKLRCGLRQAATGGAGCGGPGVGRIGKGARGAQLVCRPRAPGGGRLCGAAAGVGRRAEQQPHGWHRGARQRVPAHGRRWKRGAAAQRIPADGRHFDRRR